MMSARLIRRTDTQRMRWKNGLGWTSELAIAPIGAGVGDAFDWRVSLAEIDADCEFSRFPGYDRTIAIVSGNGMRLSFDQAPDASMTLRGQPVEFAGEWQTRCELLDGPCRDFNLMVRRGLYATKLMLRPLVGPMVFFPEPNVSWLLHLLSGSADIRNVAGIDRLAEGETLILEPGTHADRVILNGGGELMLVRLERNGS